MILARHSRSVKDQKNRSTVIGWREWVALPELNLPAIKIKADTGARTSCLHAINIEPYDNSGVPFVRFSVAPLQQRDTFLLECHARVVDQRRVRDSGGHTEMRYVIESQMQIGQHKKQIDITLTHRHGMRFRMLLGRSALTPNLVVDASSSYRLGRIQASQFYPGLPDKKRARRER